MLEKFDALFGPAKTRREIKMEELSVDRSTVPPEVYELLRRDGVASYGDGFIWTLNPDDYVEWLNDFVDFKSTVVPFGRTAFGDFFFVHNGEVMILLSNKGFVDYTTSRADWFFNRYLTDTAYLDKYFDKKVFDQLKGRDQLEWDECYGFVPLPALGGEVNVESATRVKMREHLLLTSQAIEQVVFFPH